MAGRQLGLQMLGSSEPGDSVTPKWPVCFLRRNGDVGGCLGLENLVGGIATSYSTLPHPALLLGPPPWLWVTWNQLKVGFSEWTWVPNQ